jgi:tol-pal system protein YbgF
LTFKEEKLKKFGRIKTWIILPIGVFLFGCATIRDVRILDREIDKLHSELSALRNENKSFENKLYSELSALRKENNSLENKISVLSDENQNLKTEFLFRLENLQSEIRILSTGIEEYKDYLKRPSKEIGRVKEDVEVRLRILEERRKNLEEKIREMEDRLKGAEGKMKQMESEKSGPTKEVLSEPKGLSAGMGDLYKDAYETFQKGDLEGARRKFEAFLKQYPNTELSGNAQFWIGETYYQKKDFERAILEYEKAITKYPETGKIPAALFKQALAFLELGDKTNARNLLRRVIERFPHSDQAEMAKKKLETIK